MKSILKGLIAFLLCLSSITPVAASNRELYFLSVDTTNVDKYVVSIIYDFLTAYTGKEVSNEIYKLGNGVKVDGTSDGEYYLYPVFQNNMVKYVCRIHYDGTEYTSTFSEMFADEFNDILNESYSGVNSLMIFNDNLILIQNEAVTVWDKDRMNNQSYSERDVLAYSKTRSIGKIKNLMDTLEYDDSINSINTFVTNTSYELLIDIAETQGNDSWCAGYAAACIIRYMKEKTNIYAKTIATYGGITSTTTGIPRSVIKKYALNKHQITVTEYDGVLSMTKDVINEQLAAYNPIYGAYQRTTDSAGHAVVVYGFDNTYVYFWNPWYSYKEMYKFNAYAFVAGNGDKFVAKGHMTFED